jgi:hypothetical protein
MLSPRLTNCPECANIPSLLKKIDCKLAELGNNLYNNISYMLNKPVPADDILQLIGYRRILQYKYINPNYAHRYSVNMIASRVIRLTVGCVSKCNEPERCLEEPCNITIVPNPTTTTTTLAPYYQWTFSIGVGAWGSCNDPVSTQILYTSAPILTLGVAVYQNSELTNPFFANGIYANGGNSYTFTVASGPGGLCTITNITPCVEITTTTSTTIIEPTTTTTTTV